MAVDTITPSSRRNSVCLLKMWRMAVLRLAMMNLSWNIGRRPVFAGVAIVVVLRVDDCLMLMLRERS